MKKIRLRDEQVIRMLIEACDTCSPHYLDEAVIYLKNKNNLVTVYQDCPDCNIEAEIEKG